MNIKQAYQQLLLQLSTIYDNREAANIANWVIEYITEQNKINRILHPDIPISEKQLAELEMYTTQLLQHQPVQYVLKEAWFFGLHFYVNEHVLIPRPETEELVKWTLDFLQENNLKEKKVLEIGTGSGCISIALKKNNPHLQITSIDISAEALAVAKQNASSLQSTITFKEINFLIESNWDKLEQYYVIISNPPYIKESEKDSINKNVLAYEPHLALFVLDTDALIFYKKIAAFGKQHLLPKGKIFVEINEALGKETQEVFEQTGYTTQLKKDLQGKERMLMAIII